jgi:hypothetical protein
MAKKLGITQDTVSRLEKRNALLLSTLRKTIKAMGGNLSLVAKFPDNKLNDVNVRTKTAADSFGNLNTARANLRKKFDEVITELSNSKSSQTRQLGATFSDDDKKKFENYISVIESEIKRG